MVIKFERIFRRACDLTDISELKYLTQVEILTLSVNKIKTLESLKYCTNLKELYIRDNQISDINQLFYLKNLQQLRILWLADNPCALDNNYRLITLKVLPNLHKLDNAGMFFKFISEFLIDFYL